MNPQSFLNIPYIKLVLNLCIIGILVANINFGYRNWLVISESQSKIDELAALTDDNRSTVERTDYYNSDLYKEKVFKEEGFQRKGEQVLQTNLKEVYLDKGQVAYIPINSTDNSSNIQKWWQCLVGGLITNTKQQADVYCKPL